MMPEISLSVLDIAQNSIHANATLIIIEIAIDTKLDSLLLKISDNGYGMTSAQLQNATDPFYTTRTTRKIGLGIPFLKAQTIITGGTFHIESVPLQGTTIICNYVLSHINRMPLGDMVSTIHALVTGNINIDFIYTYKVDGSSFTLETKEFRAILGEIPFNTNEVSNYIRDYLSENMEEINQKNIF